MLAPLPQVGTSPSVMVFDDMQTNYAKGQEWVSPSFSNEVFERAGVEKVSLLYLTVFAFNVLLLLLILFTCIPGVAGSV